MSDTPDRDAAMFPTLDATQIARLAAFGERQHAEPGAVLFDQGDASHGVFVVLDGSLDIVGVSGTRA